MSRKAIQAMRLLCAGNCPRQSTALSTGEKICVSMARDAMRVRFAQCAGESRAASA
jgi:hypothetical protein